MIEGRLEEAKRQQDAAIAAGNVREAGDYADVITALERRRSVVGSIQAATKRQLAQEASHAEWKALEQDNAAIVSDAGDCGAEMEAHGRVGRQILARWEAIYERIQAYERKWASHIARYGAAPETIPLFDDHGMSKILGVTQSYVYGLKLAAEGSVKMERFAKG